MTNRQMAVKLNEAVDRRIARENEFIEDIIAQINQAIVTLDECDPSNARTEIDLTQQQLSDIIFKLNDIKNMTDRTTSIANIVKDKQLMRRPVVSPSPEALPTPPASLTSSVSPVPPLPPVPPPQSTTGVAKPGTPLGNIMNPGAETSKGINPNLTPGRRGGRRTRRFRKK
jgi:hypothetical protein